MRAGRPPKRKGWQARQAALDTADDGRHAVDARGQMPAETGPAVSAAATLCSGAVADRRRRPQAARIARSDWRSERLVAITADGS
jgi:hypothetical protein